MDSLVKFGLNSFIFIALRTVGPPVQRLLKRVLVDGYPTLLTFFWFLPLPNLGVLYLEVVTSQRPQHLIVLPGCSDWLAELFSVRGGLAMVPCVVVRGCVVSKIKCGGDHKVVIFPVLNSRPN